MSRLIHGSAVSSDGGKPDPGHDPKGVRGSGFNNIYPYFNNIYHFNNIYPYFVK